MLVDYSWFGLIWMLLMCLCIGNCRNMNVLSW